MAAASVLAFPNRIVWRCWHLPNSSRPHFLSSLFKISGAELIHLVGLKTCRVTPSLSSWVVPYWHMWPVTVWTFGCLFGLPRRLRGRLRRRRLGRRLRRCLLGRAARRGFAASRRHIEAAAGEGARSDASRLRVEGRQSLTKGRGRGVLTACLM